MEKAILSTCLVAIAAGFVQAAAVNPVTSVTPTGTLDGGAGQETILTSVTADGQTFTPPALSGIKGTGFVHLVPDPASSFTNGRGTGLGSTNNRQSLVGLQVGRALLGIDNEDEFIRTYFVDADNNPTPVGPGGYIFIFEWAAERDNFVVDLLTNTNTPVGPNNFTNPVVAASVTVMADDYTSNTGLEIVTNVAGTQPIGGVAIKLADVGVSGITGIQIRPTDPTGGFTGLDLAAVAVVIPEPGSLLLALAGAGMVIARRRR